MKISKFSNILNINNFNKTIPKNEEIKKEEKTDINDSNISKYVNLLKENNFDDVNIGIELFKTDLRVNIDNESIHNLLKNL